MKHEAFCLNFANAGSVLRLVRPSHALPARAPARLAHAFSSRLKTASVAALSHPITSVAGRLGGQKARKSWASPQIAKWVGDEPLRCRHSARICLIRAIASSTACSGLMPSAATRWIAFAQTCSC